jgi:hypothetical protein
LLLLRRRGARDLDFSYQICDRLRPNSRTVAVKLPPTYNIGGMTRDPMRHTDLHLTALSVANAWSFNRASKWLGMCAGFHGFVSQMRHEPRLRQKA